MLPSSREFYAAFGLVDTALSMTHFATFPEIKH
jgi:hypothetical protein